jgi:hypothetical protein
MNRVLRAVITCLLLVAMPLQGYAAGSMLFCGPAAGMSEALEHHHDHATAHEGQEEHHLDAGSAHVDDVDAPQLHHVTHGKCSVCSSCCSAAVLPSTPIKAATVLPHAAPSADFAHANPGQGPERLDRPPRFHLA